LNKDVRKNARKDKNEFFNAVATQAENVVLQHNINQFYKRITTLSTKRQTNKAGPERREGKTISAVQEQKREIGRAFP